MLSWEDAAAGAKHIKERLAAEKQATVVTREQASFMGSTPTPSQEHLMNQSRKCEQASFMGFNTDTYIGKYTAIVKLENGMSERDARSDAISMILASFGSVSAFRVGNEAYHWRKSRKAHGKRRNPRDGVGWRKGTFPSRKPKTGLQGFRARPDQTLKSRPVSPLRLSRLPLRVRKAGPCSMPWMVMFWVAWRLNHLPDAPEQAPSADDD